MMLRLVGSWARAQRRAVSISMGMCVPTQLLESILCARRELVVSRTSRKARAYFVFPREAFMCEWPHCLDVAASVKKWTEEARNKYPIRPLNGRPRSRVALIVSGAYHAYILSAINISIGMYKEKLMFLLSSRVRVWISYCFGSARPMATTWKWQTATEPKNPDYT